MLNARISLVPLGVRQGGEGQYVWSIAFSGQNPLNFRIARDRGAIGRFQGLSVAEMETVPSLPSEQPIFEVKRHLAKSHFCESQETIKSILRIGVNIGDRNAPCPYVVFAE